MRRQDRCCRWERSGCYTSAGAQTVGLRHRYWSTVSARRARNWPDARLMGDRSVGMRTRPRGRPVEYPTRPHQKDRVPLPPAEWEFPARWTPVGAGKPVDGPRLQLFLSEGHERVSDLLAEKLPRRVRGWPTRFAPVPDDPGVHQLTDGAEGRHLVDAAEPGAWFVAELGFDPRAGVTTADWLATPTQRLTGVVGGAVFHDGPGELTAARRDLAWYPTDVWRYVLACQWHRIAQEEPFVGRCAEVGDELGERVVTARLVRDLMRLCLLLARRYPPYSKWLGSAFSALSETSEVAPVLRRALTSTDPKQDLSEAYRMVAAWQNRTGLAEPLSPEPRSFHSRPFPVLDAGRYMRCPEVSEQGPRGG